MAHATIKGLQRTAPCTGFMAAPWAVGSPAREAQKVGGTETFWTVPWPCCHPSAVWVKVFLPGALRGPLGEWGESFPVGG